MLFAASCKAELWVATATQVTNWQGLFSFVTDFVSGCFQHHHGFFLSEAQAHMLEHELKWNDGNISHVLSLFLFLLFCLSSLCYDHQTHYYSFTFLSQSVIIHCSTIHTPALTNWNTLTCCSSPAIILNTYIPAPRSPSCQIVLVLWEFCVFLITFMSKHSLILWDWPLCVFWTWALSELFLFNFRNQHEH